MKVKLDENLPGGACQSSPEGVAGFPLVDNQSSAGPQIVFLTNIDGQQRSTPVERTCWSGARGP